jgi:hypothetical protein
LRPQRGSAALKNQSFSGSTRKAHFAAAYGALPAYVEIERATPILPGPGTLVGARP